MDRVKKKRLSLFLIKKGLILGPLIIVGELGLYVCNEGGLGLERALEHIVSLVEPSDWYLRCSLLAI